MTSDFFGAGGGGGLLSGFGGRPLVCRPHIIKKSQQLDEIYYKQKTKITSKAQYPMGRLPTYSIDMKVKNGLQKQLRSRNKMSRQRDLKRQNAENYHKITITLSTHKLNISSTIQFNIDKKSTITSKIT